VLRKKIKKIFITKIDSIPENGLGQETEVDSQDSHKTPINIQISPLSIKEAAESDNPVQ